MLESLLTQVAHIARPKGRVDGVETFEGVERVCVRHENVNVVVLGSDQRERRAQHKVASSVEIPYDSLYWPPGADTTDQNAATRPLTYNKASYPDLSLTLYETFF